jgi:hypothetical protein
MELQKYIETNSNYTTIQKKALVELLAIFELKNNGEINENNFENLKNKVIYNAIKEEKEIMDFDVIKKDMKTEFNKGSIGKIVYESSIKQFEENRKKLIKEKQEFYINEMNMLIDLDPSEIEMKLERKVASEHDYKSYKRIFFFYILSSIFFIIGIFYFPFLIMSVLFAMLGLGYTIIEKINILIEQNNRKIH